MFVGRQPEHNQSNSEGRSDKHEFASVFIALLLGINVKYTADIEEDTNPDKRFGKVSKSRTKHTDGKALYKKFVFNISSVRLFSL